MHPTMVLQRVVMMSDEEIAYRCNGEGLYGEQKQRFIRQRAKLKQEQANKQAQKQEKYTWRVKTVKFRFQQD